MLVILLLSSNSSAQNTVARRSTALSNTAIRSTSASAVDFDSDRCRTEAVSETPTVPEGASGVGVGAGTIDCDWLSESDRVD